MTTRNMLHFDITNGNNIFCSVSLQGMGPFVHESPPLQRVKRTIPATLRGGKSKADRKSGNERGSEYALSCFQVHRECFGNSI